MLDITMQLNISLNIIFIYTAEALAKLVTEENYKKGLIYPPFSDIRTISANIAADVAAKAYELGLCSLSQLSFIIDYPFVSFDILLKLTIVFNFFLGLATRLPRPQNLVKYAESCMYTPVYRNYR